MLENISIKPETKTAWITFFKELKDFFIENIILWFFSFTVWLKILEFNRIIGTFYYKPILWYSTFVLSLILFTPFVFLRKKKTQAAITMNGLVTFIVISSLIYWRYFTSLPTIDNLAIIGNSSEITDSIAALAKVRDIIFALDILVVLALYFVSRKLRQAPQEKKRNYFLPVVTLISSFALLAPVYAVDYDHYLPFYANKVYDNKMTTERYGLLGAQYLDIYRKVTSKKRISQKEKEKLVEEIKANYYKAQEPNGFTGVAKGKNIVAIQVESLETSVIGKKVQGKEVTPNLNKLVSESHYFPNRYFEMGFGNTSDTDFTFNTSLHPLLDAASFMKYGKADFTSLPKYLKEQGYSANAYHAYIASFWNRGTAYKSLGYEQFYNEKNYSGSKVAMGINDLDFMAQTYDYSKEKKAPSFDYIVTLSSHFPFDLPAGVGNLNLDPGKLSPADYRYFRSINYADQAIGELIEKYKKDGRYNDTVFVVFGDHYAKHDQFSGNIKDDMEAKKVPLIIRLPNQKEKVQHNGLLSTIDLMPTILNLVGYDKPFLHFGRDIFGKKEPFFNGVVYFGNGLAADNRYIYFKGGADEVNSGQCYNASWFKKPNAECTYLFERAKKDYKYSSDLIKYNLFSEIK